MTDRSARAMLEQQRRRFRLTIEDCWAAYFALGGHNELTSLRAFLHGDLTLPQAEIDILAAAIGDLVPASQSALWSATIRASEGLGPSTGTGTPGPSDAIFELIAGQRLEDANEGSAYPRFHQSRSDLPTLNCSYAPDPRPPSEQPFRRQRTPASLGPYHKPAASFELTPPPLPTGRCTPAATNWSSF